MKNIYEMTSPDEFRNLIEETNNFEELNKIAEHLNDKVFIEQKDGSFAKVIDFDAEKKKFINKETLLNEMSDKLIIPCRAAQAQQGAETRSLEETLCKVQDWVDWLNSAYEEDNFCESRKDSDYLAVVSGIKGRLNIVNFIYNKNFELVIGCKEKNIEDDCAYAYIKNKDGVISERELEIDRW